MAVSEIPSRGAPRPDDPPATARVAFPQSQDDFAQDPRVSYSKLDGGWILEDDDGSEWEWDEAAARWMPSLDEALLERQRAAYAVPGVDESDTVQQQKKKRKKGQNGEEGASKKARQGDHARPERKNTAVYVTSLPLDVTADEVNATFSKYGVIAEEIDSGAPRIKLYHGDDGKPKGDALVVYFRPESVQLAITMLDDTDFRLGEKGPLGSMRVKEADYSYKKQKEPDAADGGGGGGGESKPDKAALRQKARDRDKIIKRTQKLNSKLADWDDDDPQALPDTSNRWDKVVILEHMFTMDELQEDPAALLEIKEDIRDECSKLGEVTNVVLFDREPDGIATVRFASPTAAEACVRMMHGRHFGGQQVQAYLATGAEKFKRTREKKAGWDEDDDGEEGKRLDEFGEWLEKGEEGEGAGPGGGEEAR